MRPPVHYLNSDFLLTACYATTSVEPKRLSVNYIIAIVTSSRRREIVRILTRKPEYGPAWRTLASELYVKQLATGLHYGCRTLRETAGHVEVCLALWVDSLRHNVGGFHRVGTAPTRNVEF